MLKMLYFGRNNKNTIALSWIVFEVVLMVGFGFVEGLQGLYFGNNRFGKFV